MLECASNILLRTFLGSVLMDFLHRQFVLDFGKAGTGARTAQDFESDVVAALHRDLRVDSLYCSLCGFWRSFFLSWHGVLLWVECVIVIRYRRNSRTR